MATNQVFDEGQLDTLQLTVTHPASPTSGDPVRYGAGGLTGVALTDEDTVTGRTTVALNGTWLLAVEGVNGAGASEVAAGDAVYYVDAGDPTPLSKVDTGVLFGYVVETPDNPGTVAGDATGTVGVRLTN